MYKFFSLQSSYKSLSEFFLVLLYKILHTLGMYLLKCSIHISSRHYLLNQITKTVALKMHHYATCVSVQKREITSLAVRCRNDGNTSRRNCHV